MAVSTGSAAATRSSSTDSLPSPTATVVSSFGLTPDDPGRIPTAEEANYLLPVDKAMCAELAQPLVWKNGDPAAAQLSSRRLCCFAGPGATLRGAGAQLAQLRPDSAGLSVDQCSRASLTYSSVALELPGTGSNSTWGRADDGGVWLVGRCLPFPVEHAEDGSWGTDVSQLSTWAAECDARWLAALDVPVAPLPFPDPDADTEWAKTASAPLGPTGPVDTAAAETLATDLRVATLTNPFAELYETFFPHKAAPSRRARGARRRGPRPGDNL